MGTYKTAKINGTKCVGLAEILMSAPADDSGITWTAVIRINSNDVPMELFNGGLVEFEGEFKYQDKTTLGRGKVSIDEYRSVNTRGIQTIFLNGHHKPKLQVKLF